MLKNQLFFTLTLTTILFHFLDAQQTLEKKTVLIDEHYGATNYVIVDDDFVQQKKTHQGLTRNLHTNKKSRHLWVKQNQKTVPFRLIKEYSCPEGMTLSGNKCTQRLIYSPRLYCPEQGELSNENECVIEKKLNVSCPYPYVLQNNECFFNETFSATLTCPGFNETFDPKIKACRNPGPAFIRCPDKYVLSENKTCIKITPSYSKCPENYTYSFQIKQCVKTNLTKAEIICPEGSRFNKTENFCVHFKPPTSSCPTLYTLNTTLNRCIRYVPKMLGLCPEGYIQVDDVLCEKKKKVSPYLHCPPDFIFEESRKICKKQIMVSPTCPSDYHLSRYDPKICEKVVQQIPVCPLGTVAVSPSSNTNLFDLQCKRSVTTSVLRSCPISYKLVDDFRCEKYEWLRPKLSCEKDCHTTKLIPLSYTCPKGTDFIYDVSDNITHGLPSCRQKSSYTECYVPPCTKPSTKLRRLQSNSTTQEDDDCLDVQKPVCKTRTHYEYYTAEPHCASGGTKYDETQCIVKVPKIPEKVCDLGTYINETDQCKNVLYQQPTDKCPEGSIKQGLHCLFDEFVPPDFACPDNTKPNRDHFCVQTQPAETPNNYKLIISPIRKCPYGLMLDSPGEWCLHIKQFPLDFICPPFSEQVPERNDCLVTTEIETSKSVKQVSLPTYKCAAGIVTTDGMCVVVDKLLPTPICDEGGTFTDNKKEECIEIKKPLVDSIVETVTLPTPVCSENTQLFKTNCIKSNRLESVKTCEDKEAQIVNNTCIKKIEPKLLCPLGTTICEEGCLKVITSQAKIDIVEGCIYESRPRCTHCPKPFYYKCNNNYR